MKKQQLTHKESEAIRQIRSFLMRYGRAPSVRKLMSVMGYRSPRSTAVIINQLIRKGFLRRKPDDSLQLIKNLKDDKTHAQTVEIPLVGEVACGTMVLAEENIEAMIPVSTKLVRPPHKYFLLKAHGDSMNKANINDGDLILVRQQLSAENNDVVVALIDDETTIKEFHFSNEAIVLKPRSKNKQHRPIILTRDFQIQGVVVKSIPNLY
ncbi:transcriptional repressor LexA [Patescibacteria group bacterium AH-259-L07]|nr:transcriptional repressor LexA [Patescibacteria group bacterium AH-259-L07]